MQSFLQYRRFGKHVRRQYERDQEKAAALRREAQLGTDSRTQEQASVEEVNNLSGVSANTAVEDHALDARDLEKAEGSSDMLGEEEPAAPELEAHTTNETSRISSHATTHSTLNTMGTHLGQAMTGIQVRTMSRNEGRIFVVGYEGDDDIMNPHNWSWVTRWMATINIAWVGFIVGLASSIDSGALDQAAEDFGVSQVVESLATGLFLVGFGVGALFAGPWSETVGRNPVYIVTLSIYMIWLMAAGLAPNIGAQLVFRFLGGFFASTPLTCAAGTLSDLFSPMERIYTFPIFANAAFMGPLFGPIIGGFIGQSSLISWRWTEWITLIWSALILFLIFFFQPETYAPILLKWKAEHLRRLTGDDRYRAEVEIRGERFIKRLGRSLYRPFLLTATEPIIVLFALYLTVVYIILFAFLNGYTFIFTETYGFSQGLTGLVFLGIAVGLCLCTCLVPLIYHWAQKDMQKVRAEGGDRLPPEFRLWYAIFGGPAIPISLFWMGWTAYPSISPWSPIMASVLFGFGILTIFISAYQYIIDAYEVYAASALASVTFIRYVAAGGMVEVAIPMYTNLGVHWTLTVLGCISALMVPVPYAFMVWGPKIRGWSKYAKV
ncbi:MAG: blue light receptor [Chaenotheca gracillima]|nr:MAG: blue light receptor [Chaenotheca gracillima]